MTPKDFRRIALGMDGAYEASHMNHPDFRAPNGKIFATLNEDQTRGMASLTPEQQEDFIERAPDVFIPAAGAWGRGGSTMIVLAEVDDEEIVGEAVTLAYQRITAAAAKRPAASPKSSSTSRVAGSRRTPAPATPSPSKGVSPSGRARKRRP